MESFLHFHADVVEWQTPGTLADVLEFETYELIKCYNLVHLKQSTQLGNG